MEKRRKKYISFSLSFIIGIFVLSVVLSCASFAALDSNVSENISVTNTGLTITTNSSDGFGEFKDGARYVYTDKNLVDKYRAGDVNTPYDVSTHRVAKTSSNRGSQDNPYVIASISDWEAFVQKMALDANKGRGQYYVLANDLDFNGVDFHPVTEFNGTFYGFGKSIKNISCDSWQYWTGRGYSPITMQTSTGYGLFCKTNGATLTDLSVENFSYREMPAPTNYIFTDVGASALFTGGIVGYSIGEDILLNCHTSGEITSTIAYNYINAYGGLVGEHGSCNSDMYIYRCSSELKKCEVTNVGTTYWVSIGGIIGEATACGNKVIKIYDCVANVKTTVKQSRHFHIGGIVGLFIYGMVTDMQNVIATVDSTSAVSQDAGVLGCYWQTANPVNIKNAYVEGTHGTSTNKKSMHAVTSSVDSKPSVDNLNLTKSLDSFANTANDRNYPATDPATHYTDISVMYNDAKTFFSTSQYSRIWDTEKIGGTYEPDNSPVRNYLLAFVTYRNLTDGGNGEEAVGLKSGADGDPFMVENALYEPSDAYMATKPNHVFMGWTDDKDGNSEPFTELPAGYFGEITLYAVWGLPSSYLSNIKAELTAKDSVEEIEYDGKKDITLNAVVKDNGGAMTSPKVTYKWYKDDGTNSIATNTNGELKRIKVADSGTYTYEYRIQDGEEPLWMYDDDSRSVSKKITINKGKPRLSATDFEITTSAYYGMKLRDVEFVAKVKDSGGNLIEGTSRWTVGGQDITEGINQAKIHFEPTDKDNYLSEDLDVTFESENMKLTFNLDSEIAGEKIEVGIKYGETLFATEIKDGFLEVFRKKIDTESTEYDSRYDGIANLAPYFDGVAITEYNIDKPNVTSPITIEVTFVDKSYTITYEPDNGEKSKTVTAKYNERLIPIADPVKEGYVFLGWYSETDTTTGKPIHWDFLKDRVSGDMTLTADWFKAVLTLQDIEVTVKEGGYEALSELKDGDLEVIAHYTYTDDAGEEQTLDLKIRLDEQTGYKITYSSGDNKLHVNSPGITVTYTYSGVTKTKRPEIKVNAKSLDEVMVANGVTFEDYEVKYDGTAKKMKEIDESKLPVQISGVKYEYWQGGVQKNADEIIDIGEYIVRAIFESGDPDYKASAMEAKLTISRTGGSGNNDPDNPSNPDNPNNPDDPDDTDNDGNGGALDEILAKIKDLPLWQLIASGISIILIIAFLSKTASNESKRKKAKKVMEKKYNTFYATAFLGISVTNWTVIACVLMGTAVLSLIFMIISQKRRNKAEEELEDAKEEYAKHREEMMFMRMNGGNNGGQGQGFAYAQPSLGADEIRGIVSETMTAMLPGMQQMLPQQASNNDELINKLIEQNAHNEERIRELTEHSDKRIEKLMKQLSEQKPVEKVIEREVAATNVSEEIIDKLASKLQPTQTNISESVLEQLASKLQPIALDETILKVVSKTEENDGTIKQLLRNQEKLMEKILELSANKPIETQVVEKEVRVEVPVEVEKIVEKEVVKEVKVEVPVEVEKIVEKEVPVEKIVEVPIEVEKVVEKIVEIPATKPAPKAKTTAPRLTLDEAYAKLSAKQKKFFDTLKEYAMSKDKCKEKKSTYYILLGQSSVNPLVKLTIKKDCTVALFKMEDEYMKDIRRNAGSEGTKVKVKETELIVGDSQALATAKEMIDLREDQIERYNDFLKEQRTLRKK